VTESEIFRATREGYDANAQRYADSIRDSMRDRPMERAMLGAFAELVKAAGPGPVADLGCGPGYLTDHLHGLGLDAFGIDLSPAMVALARETYPHLRFEQGLMAELDLPDGALAGILSRASIIHTPPERVPATFAEFFRVLAPGGHLLLDFPADDHPGQAARSYDHKIALAYTWLPDRIADLLRGLGFAEIGRMVREPEKTDRRQFQVVQILARKPGPARSNAEM
jgi:SAM-dependent methyltransferase